MAERDRIKKHIRALKIRARLIQAVREYFSHNEFLEIDTPTRCPAIIPEAQIDPVTSEDWYLQASPEQAMKRLLSKGYGNIFQICKTFRKNERGRFHLPEFTLLEWYSVGSTYLDLMDQCRSLIRFIARRLECSDPITYQGKPVWLNKEWQTLTAEDAFERYADLSLETALEQGRFDEIVSFQVEPHMGVRTPGFLMDYPARLASLAQLIPDNPEYAQRVELYIAGIELANGFTELTDAREQRARFEKENEIRTAAGSVPLPMPEKFLNDLESMPPAAGIALGLDRLVMIFADAASIDEVVAFTPETL